MTPALGSLNDRLVALATAWPTGGGYAFEPGARMGPEHNPRDPEHDGTGVNLHWRGEGVARGHTDGATYCCGVTLGLVWQTLGANVDAIDDVSAFIDTWFCPTIGHGGCVDALVNWGLGTEVEANLAVPGDLCQFWRNTSSEAASGHSVLFLGWEDGDRVRYWSSQASTNGVGVKVETIGAEWDLRFARLGA